MKRFELMFNEEQKAVDTKLMYENLGLNKNNYSRWATKNIVENEFFEENKDYQGFFMMKNGNKTKNFWLSIEMAKHLCMTANTEQSHNIRNYFIECEKRAKEIQPVNNNEFTTKDILKLATAEIEKLETQLIETTKRKDEVTNVLNTIQTYGDNLLFREFVKIVYNEKNITISEKEFRSMLKKQKYIDNKNYPYAQYKKYFNVNRGVKNGKTYHTTRLTAKGQLYFVNKLIKMFEE